MAKSQNPMTGKMSGAMGNFVTSSLGSQNIVKAKAFGRRNVKTVAQQKQRDGFRMIGELFPLLGSIPFEGFIQSDSSNSVYAAFMTANLSSGIDKSGDVAAIDYASIKLTDGKLAPPTVKSATLSAAGITISYQSSLRNYLNLPTDELVALALTQAGELWIERQPRGSDAESTIVIPMEDVVAEDVLGVYVFAKRADGSKVTKTVYVPLV
ncbi:MAG: hypothetical protein KA206_09950 [Paludibacter sp.]|nr:hypothetical protein [Paludibacter sp.]